MAVFQSHHFVWQEATRRQPFATRNLVSSHLIQQLTVDSQRVLSFGGVEGVSLTVSKLQLLRSQSSKYKTWTNTNCSQRSSVEDIRAVDWCSPPASVSPCCGGSYPSHSQRGTGCWDTAAEDEVTSAPCAASEWKPSSPPHTHPE